MASTRHPSPEEKVQGVFKDALNIEMTSVAGVDPSKCNQPQKFIHSISTQLTKC